MGLLALLLVGEQLLLLLFCFVCFVFSPHEAVLYLVQVISSKAQGLALAKFVAIKRLQNCIPLSVFQGKVLWPKVVCAVM